MTKKKTCPNCGSTNTVSNGANKAGTPMILCKDCGKSRTLSGRKPGGQPKKKKLTRAQIQADYRKRHKVSGNEHREKKKKGEDEENKV